jgi:hypothetical protein
MLDRAVGDLGQRLGLGVAHDVSHLLHVRQRLLIGLVRHLRRLGPRGFAARLAGGLLDLVHRLVQHLGLLACERLQALVGRLVGFDQRLHVLAPGLDQGVDVDARQLEVLDHLRDIRERVGLLGHVIPLSTCLPSPS